MAAARSGGRRRRRGRNRRPPPVQPQRQPKRPRGPATPIGQGRRLLRKAAKRRPRRALDRALGDPWLAPTHRVNGGGNQVLRIHGWSVPCLVRIARSKCGAPLLKRTRIVPAHNLAGSEPVNRRGTQAVSTRAGPLRPVDDSEPGDQVGRKSAPTRSPGIDVLAYGARVLDKER
jgi:hypothetical protein